MLLRRLALLLLAATALPAAAQEPVLMLDPGGHTAAVNRAVFTPDGREVITVSDDKTIRVWDAMSGVCVRVLRPHVGYGDSGRLYAAALSPDGDTLAASGSVWKYGIYIISLSRGTIDRVLTGHREVIRGLAFSPDGKHLVSAGGDNTAKIWNVKSGECEQTLQGHTKILFGVAYSPDGRRVVTASADGTARIWDAATGQALAELKGHTDLVRCVAWCPDGRTIATASWDKTLRLWEADGTPRKAFSSAKSSFTSLTFTPDSKAILLTRRPEEDGSEYCSILDLEAGTERVRYDKHRSTVRFGSLSKDGSLAATCDGAAHQVHVWRTDNGQAVSRLTGRARGNWSAAWSADSSTIAWGTERRADGNSLLANQPLDSSFRLAELEWGRAPDTSYIRGQSSLGGLTLEKTDRMTVTVTVGGAVRATLKPEEKAPDDAVTCFTLLSGNRAAVGTMYGLFLFDALTGQPAAGLENNEVQGHAGAVWAVAPSPDGRYLLSASHDQTLRVWNLKSRNPLLSLFFAGNEWIAWTQEGYYAASPGGEGLMGWQVNHGRNEFGEFHPASRFHKELYRPDVIKLLLKHGNLPEALAEADRVLGRVMQPTSVEKILPPKVIIEPTSGGASGDELNVTASAEARGDHAVTSMQLLLDGQPFDGKAGIRRFDQPGDEAKANWQVRLTPGKHVVQVLANSAVSTGGSAEMVLHRDGAKKPSQRPKLAVLAVGVSQYKNASVGKLDYAAGDARAVTRAFELAAKELFREVSTKLLIDGEATRGNMLDGLDWLAKEITQDDYAIVFFAGHGEMDNIGNVYFLPVDAERDKLRRTAVAGDELMKSFRDLPPSKRVLILDACHAGALSTGKTRGGGVTDNLARELLLPENGVVVMCSSTGREFSQESHQHKMGVFSLALTEGLAGKGPKDNGGLVFTHHLHSYVCDRVKELTGGQQHPVMKNPDEVRSFPISKP